MGKNDYEITLKNCRSVKSVNGGTPLIIKKNALNVYYGRNGAGKSTIGLAIRHAFDGSDESLELLESYAYLDSERDAALAPAVSCSTRIKTLHVFNDAWVDAHCFVKGSLQSNAYELYVRDDDVRKLEKKRKNKLGMLDSALKSGDVETLKDSLEALKKGLGGLKAGGEFKASAPVVKAFKSGVPTEPLPVELTQVIKGMSAKEKAQWLSWHTDRPALKSADICPYCGHRDFERVDSCRSYDESREQREVKPWAAIANMYDSIGSFLSRSNAALLGKILNSRTTPTKSELDALAKLAGTVDSALAALENLSRMMSEVEYMDTSKLVPALQDESLKLSVCGIFLKTRQGSKTSQQKGIDAIDRAVAAISAAQVDLDKLSKALLASVASNVKGHEAEVNRFLLQCGYLYEIEIESNPQTSEARILLKPTGVKSKVLVDNPVSALSYGERNALALALFMFEALTDPRSLVILDDPISSFDFDKRYGILYALFSKDDSVFAHNLNGHSVLVMTHDFLVVNDLLNIPGKNMAKTKGCLISNERGVLRCEPLSKGSIAPYTQILQRKIRESKCSPLIIRLVYIRQFCEMIRKNPSDRTTKESWTFRLLSGVIHGHSIDKVMRDNGFQSKRNKWVIACENYIEKLTGERIDFWKVLDRYRNCISELVNEYYEPVRTPMEKLILVRLMIMRDAALGEGSSIMKRFADETCHIGGSYLFQIDDGVYNQVPFYVLDWCDDVVAKAAAKCKPSAKAALGALEIEQID